MTSAISPISSVESAGKSSITDMMAGLGQSLERHENTIRDSFSEGLAPNGDVMGVPKYIQDQFKTWDQQFTAPEDLARVADLKRKVLEINTANQDYIERKIGRNADKMQLELAMKAISKTTQGLQQILSSQ